MKVSAHLALAAALVATAVAAPAMASEPVNDVSKAGDAATRALQARYPARPAEYRADGSISQYIGASHLMQTVVRIGDDGKLEQLCTSDEEAARKFITAASDERTAKDAGEDQ